MQKSLNKHKVLLIEPPFYRLFRNTYSLNLYPLSLGYLAGEIKKDTDWEVMVYNADFNPDSEMMKISYLAGKGFNNYIQNLKDRSYLVWKEIEKTIVDYNPDVVGISVKSQNFASSKVIANITKALNKNIIVIVGGPHPSMVGSEVLNCKDIDICVKGEGEKTIIELLKSISARKSFKKIDGIGYKEKGKIIETSPRKLINNLDSLCFPHEYASEVLKDYDKYHRQAFRGIFAIRGCPHNCLFCGSHKIWGRKPRFRSPENVLDEIKNLQKSGLRYVHFEDDTFGVKKEYIQKLCQLLIKEDLKIRWGCEFHVNLVDSEIITLMKKAGCFSIQLGVESGNNGLLKAMNKNLTIEKAFSAARLIKRCGLELSVFFMVGFPQETEETLKDTFQAMKKLKCDNLIYSIFTPYPGTKIFDFCKAHNLIQNNFDFSLYNHQSPLNCFCLNLKPKDFRKKLKKIEIFVDRKNRINRIKNLFSIETYPKIKELGFLQSFKKAVSYFY